MVLFLNGMKSQSFVDASSWLKTNHRHESVAKIEKKIPNAQNNVMIDLMQTFRVENGDLENIFDLFLNVQ
jgi:hypothetical protein